MMSKFALSLALAGALVAGVGCSSTPEQAAQICVDPATHVRYADEQCEVMGSYPNPPLFVWWYVMPGYVIPAYGWPATHYVTTPPRGYTTARAPSSGGTISKRSVWRRDGKTTPTIRPTSAATMAPAPKRDRWTQPPPANRQPPAAQPKPQTQPRQQYKPPVSQPKPPTYPKYR